MSYVQLFFPTRDQPLQWNVRCHNSSFGQGLYTVVYLGFFQSSRGATFLCNMNQPTKDASLLPGFPFQVNVGVDQQSQPTTTTSLFKHRHVQQQDKTSLLQHVHAD
jgi:hypothetical protein